MTGRDFWVVTLRPWAAAGYTRGLLDDLEVTLVNEIDGNEVHLPRPSASWSRADFLVRELEQDDPDPDDPVRRGIVYSMRAPTTGDRLELSV
jgi:hypothetical protein